MRERGADPGEDYGGCGGAVSAGGTPARRAPRSLEEAEEHSWVDHAVRLGMVAYGVVHLLVAWLVLELAIGRAQGATTLSGAMAELARQPFGQVGLWLVALGMLLLVGWRLLEVAAGHRRHDGAARAGRRVLSLLAAVVYAVVGTSAVRVALGAGSGGGRGDGTDGPTGQVLRAPGGPLLVGLVALGVLVYAVALGVQAVTQDFREQLAPEGRRGWAGSAYVLAGRTGYAAKAVAVGIVGGLFAYAAITQDPQKSGGLDQALQQVLEQPFGRYLLGLVALGIACHGLLCFARARHLTR